MNINTTKNEKRLKMFVADMLELKTLYNTTDTILSVVGVESMVFDIIGKQQDMIIDLLSYKYEGTNVDSWISWFVFDNDWGKEKLTTSLLDSRPIKTVYDLYELITEWEKEEK